MTRTLRPALALVVAVLASCQSDTQLAGPGELPIEPLVPTTAALRRLSYAQYANAVHGAFGDDVTVPSRRALEPDVDDSGYLSVDASSVTISHRGVTQYESAAYAIAHQAMDPARRATFVPCAPSGASDAVCAEAALTPLGRHLYRRPLASDELATAVAIATDAGTQLGDFYDGLEFAIAYLLQSPSFLFREELGTDDPSLPGERTFGGYDMAGRLAFFLWNAPPDDALLDAASRGELDTEAGVRAEAERMLDDPRADGGVRELAYEWLGLADLDDLVKDTTVYTQISPEVGPSAREETLRLVTYVFREDLDARDLMTTRTTFVNRKLASIYRVRAPREDWGMVEFDEGSPRAGLLGQISILALYAHPVATSPTLRGKFIRERLLCERVPAPPVGVNTAIPGPSAEAPTLRARLLAHQEVAYCANCHVMMDDVGLGLEGFDGLGRFRDLENGVPIDASGNLDGRPFRDALELGSMLHDDARFAECIVRQVYRVASGHVETDGETGAIRTLWREFSSSGYSLRHLMLEIAASDAFRHATPPPATP